VSEHAAPEHRSRPKPGAAPVPSPTGNRRAVARALGRHDPLEREAEAVADQAAAQGPGGIRELFDQVLPGDVQVHTDPGAHAKVAAAGARAFATGSHIYLGRGESVDDVALMAHELTHVAQQARGGAPSVQFATTTDTLRAYLMYKGGSAVRPEFAAKVLGDLAALDEAELQSTMAALDDSPIEVMIRSLPLSAYASSDFKRVVGTRPAERNAALALELLSYGATDWVITDREATAGKALIDLLPQAERERVLTPEITERLFTNVPGSEGYEEGVGEQLLEGALMGDFKEDQTGWNMLGQIAVGFIPYAGQLADIRDVVASLKKLFVDGKWNDPWEWVNLVLAVVGFIPGLGDAIKAVAKKAITFMRQAGPGLFEKAMKALREHVIEPALKNFVEPLVTRFKSWIKEKLDDLAERFGRSRPEPEAPKGSTPAADAPHHVPDALIEAEVGGAVDAVIKGSGKASARWTRLISELFENFRRRLRDWAEQSFSALGYRRFQVRIEGDFIVVSASRSPDVVIIKANPKLLGQFILIETKKLKTLRKDIDELINSARTMIPVDAAIGYMLRQGAIEGTEKLGEAMAEFLVKTRFGKAAKKLFTGKGKNVLDLVYEVNGKIIVVEAKGGGSALKTRKLKSGELAMQGTKEYLEATIAVMANSTIDEVRKMGEKLQKLPLSKFEYYLSQTGELPEDVGVALKGTLSRFF
jgi:Domain of unknown function (DUF4157)